MHPLLARFLGETGGRLPGGGVMVRRGKRFRLIREFDLGPGWAAGKHPGSKRPLSMRVAKRRRRNKAASCDRRRTRGVVIRKQQRPYPPGAVYAGRKEATDV